MGLVLHNFLMATADNTDWINDVRTQYDDQPDWTKYQAVDINYGLHKINFSTKDLPGYSAETVTEIYLDPKQLEQSRIKKDQKFYITNADYPNGYLAVAGEVTEIQGLFREQQSIIDDDKRKIKFIDGLSGIRPWNSSLDSLGNYVYNLNIHDTSNIIYKNNIKVSYGTAQLLQDSPFGDKDSKGTCFTAAVREDGSYDGVSWLPQTTDIQTALRDGNTFYNFFVNLPADETKNDYTFYNLRIFYDDHGTYSNNTYSYYINILKTSDNKLKVQFCNNETNNDVIVYEATYDKFTFDGNWHHILVQLEDNNTTTIFLDNEPVFTFDIKRSNEAKSELILLSSKPENTDKNGISEYKVAQLEVYKGVYNPDEDYAVLTKQADNPDTIYKVDLTDNNLQNVPEKVYRINTTQLYCSMAPDTDSIDNNWEQQSVVTKFEIKDFGQKWANDLTPVDNIKYQFDKKYKQGRAFQFKFQCNTGDIIWAPALFYLEA